MKIRVFLLLILAQSGFATELRLTSVTQPLYLHGGDGDPRISLESVPYVTFSSDPEWRFAAICVPFIPPTGGSWKRHDVNLASLYHLAVGGSYKKDSHDILVTIDASKAKHPEGYPFTLEQVIDAVVTCVKIVYPQRPQNEGALEIAIARPDQKAEPPK